MTQLLGKITADFETQLATKISVGGTTATLASATDDDGVALPAGRYFFTIDKDSSKKEHISCTLSGTALTNIKTLSRQGTETAGVLREHRVGANVIISDFGHIKKINDLLDGTTSFDSATVLGYDGAPTISTGNQLTTKTYVDTNNALDVQLAGTQTITGAKTFTSTAKAKYNTHPTFSADEEIIDKKYADDLAIAGAPNASTTVKGLVEEATQAEFDASTDTGATGARLFAVPSVVQTGINTQTLVAGEALTVNDAVFVAKGDEGRRLSAYSTTNTVGASNGGSTWNYQSFTTGANTTKIIRVKLYGNCSGSGGWPGAGTLRIRSTPNGSDLYSTTISVPFNGGEITADSIGITVSPSTTYYIVISTSNPQGGSNIINGGTTTSYSGGVSGVSIDSGANWSTPATTVTGDFYFEVLEGDYTAGKAYKTIAATDFYSGAGLTGNFIGFAKSSVSAASNVWVKTAAVMPGFSGLTIGTTYYLSNTAGAISTSAGTVSKKVGLALSATELLIKNDN
jgi:hypothetical protein